MIVAPSTLLSDHQREDPFTISIGPAVAQAFPLAIDDTMPERMKAAIRALEGLDAITSEDLRPESAR